MKDLKDVSTQDIFDKKPGRPRKYADKISQMKARAESSKKWRQSKKDLGLKEVRFYLPV